MYSKVTERFLKKMKSENNKKDIEYVYMSNPT